MANEILIKVGTPQISFAEHASAFAPAAVNNLEVGTPTEVQLNLAAIADTEARASAKADLGATRPRQYSVMVGIETAATPTTGDVVEFYWAASPNSSAANGNPGYISGSDADYTGTPATLSEGIAQLDLIGVLVCSADVEFQIAHIGNFTPSERYGCLVVKNESGAVFNADAIESHIVFTPITDEVQ